MSVSLIKQTIKKYLYIIFSEKYLNDDNKAFIERFVAKHPLLKPKLIVVNDQVHGFKKISQKVATLEEFPIYLEMEGLIEEEGVVFIDAIDLYCETEIQCKDRLADVIYFSKMFSQFVSLERCIDVTKPLEESMVITSKIQDLLLQMFFVEEDDQDDELELMTTHSEMFIETRQFNALLSLHLRFFVEFIKVLHDILVKKKATSSVKKSVEAFFEKEGI